MAKFLCLFVLGLSFFSWSELKALETQKQGKRAQKTVKPKKEKKEIKVQEENLNDSLSQSLDQEGSAARDIASEKDPQNPSQGMKPWNYNAEEASQGED